MSDQAVFVGRSSGRRLRSRTLVWLLYAAFIVYGSLIPFQFVFDRGAAAAKLAHVPLNPLRDASERHVSFPDVAQNVLLFLPFGALGLVVMRVGRSAGVSVARVIGLAGALSLAIETAQLFTADRITALTDVLSDTTGAALGGVALLVLGPAQHRARILVSWATRDRPATFAAACAVVLATLAAWAPFDPTFDVSTIASKMRALETDVWQIPAWIRLGGADMGVRGLFLGAAVATWLPIEAAARRIAAAAALTLTFVACLTLSEVFITTRQPGLFALAVESGGTLAGVLFIARRRTIETGRQMGFVIAAVVTGIIVDAIVARQLGPVRHGSWHGQGSDAMLSVSVMAMIALAVAPIGFAAASLSTRPRMAATMTGTAVLAVVVGEALRAPLRWISVAAAIIGVLAGGWMATSGRRRFDDAVAVADSR